MSQPKSSLPDSLSKFLSDLKSKSGDVRSRAAQTLRMFVEAEAREMSSDHFTKFMNELNPLILELVNSPNSDEKMGGIMVIDEFIDLQYEQNESKIIRFANYLRMVVQQPINNSEQAILEAAAKALGHLARAGGTLTADFVESEVKRALEWLQGDRSEQRRHAAVLVLKELAEHAPTLFNVHVSSFLDYIWVALRDPKLAIREAAINALRACLNLISKRASRWRLQWYYKIFGEAQKGFKLNSTESIHGSLLTIGELLRNSGEFMLARFKEVCETVMKYREHKDKLVRKTVIQLLPLLAAFCPDAFVRGYLRDFLDYLIETLRSGQSSRDAAYLALGEMAVAVGRHVGSHLPMIIELIKSGLSPRNRSKQFCDEILLCIALLAQAVGSELTLYMIDLIDLMFANGLTETLIRALTDLVRFLPELLPSVQDRLLSTIAAILSHGASLSTLASAGSASGSGSDGSSSSSGSGSSSSSGGSGFFFSSSSSTTPSSSSSASGSAAAKGRRMSVYAAPTSGAAAAAAVAVATTTIPVSAAGVGVSGGGVISPSSSPLIVGSSIGPSGLMPPPVNLAALSISGADPVALISLALKTLGSFDFASRDLLPLVRECVLVYLDDSHPSIRREASLTCSQLLLQPAEAHSASLALVSSMTLSSTTPSLLQTSLSNQNSFPASPNSMGMVGTPAVSSAAPQSASQLTHAPSGLFTSSEFIMANGGMVSPRAGNAASSSISPSASVAPSPGMRSAHLMPVGPFSPPQSQQSQQQAPNQLTAQQQQLIIQQQIQQQQAPTLVYISPHHLALIGQVLERLLTVGIADTDWTIRRTILASLDSRFDQYLAQSENLHLLFMALNDEVFAIREQAITIIGRLAVRNPAYVMPSLRKTLIQLLTELQFSGETRHREESCRLLSHLIGAAQRLIKPYVSPILQVLLPRLNDPDVGVASCVLSALGQLSAVGGDDLVPHLPRLLPIIVASLRSNSNSSNSSSSGGDLMGSGSSSSSSTLVVSNSSNGVGNGSSKTMTRVKRDIALSTLGQLIQNTGGVIEPYSQFPDLLPAILDTLRADHAWSVRREALKTLGILGALDPTILKQNGQLDYRLGGSSAAASDLMVVAPPQIVAAGAGAGDGTTNGAASAAAANISLDLVPSSEEYYPTVAIQALMGILRDPSLSQHHNMVVQAVMFIFRSLGMKCVPFLPHILPNFLHVMRRGEDSLRDSLFQNLGQVVTLVKSHIRNYLDGIFELIHQYWTETSLLPQILSLVEEISLALKDEFKVYLSELMPHFLSILHTDRTDTRQPTIKVLHALETFGLNLDDYLYLIIPPIMRLCESNETPLSVRRAGIETIGRICRTLNFADYASRVVHPLARILDHGPAGSITTSLTGSDGSFHSGVTGSSGVSLSSGSGSGSSGSSSSSSGAGLVNMDAVPGGPLREPVLQTLCQLLVQLGAEFAVFIPMIDKIMSHHRIIHEKYSMLVMRLVQQHQLPISSHDLASLSSLVASGVISPMSFSLDDKDDHYERKIDESSSAMNIESAVKKLHVNQANLKKAWEAAQRSTKDDWLEWMRRFSVELLKESPSPALRSCSALAQKYHPLARSLFNAAFVSCWTELYDQYQDDLVRSLETAFKSPHIPPEILQALLNLAEFMEHDDKALPIDIRTLGALAEKCHAYAKALHYKELEFHTQPASTIEALISINNQLQQPEAAVGILEYAQQHHAVELKETWYEKLQRWEDALEAYERRQLEDPTSVSITLGRMRCLRALGEWERLSQLSLHLWDCADEVSLRREIAPLAAAAAWHLGQWHSMEHYVGCMDEDGADGNFFRAIVNVRKRDFPKARVCIDRARHLLDSELISMVGESYNRSYRLMVQAQQLAELEEVILYQECLVVQPYPTALSQQALLRKMWAQRLQGCQRHVDVWQDLLAVRSLVVRPEEDVPTWLHFSSLCRKSGRMALSLKVLTQLLGHDPSLTPEAPIRCSEPSITLAYLKHLWAAGFQHEAFSRLTHLMKELQAHDDNALKSKCCLKMGEWQQVIANDGKEAMIHVLDSFRLATQYDHTSYKAWHAWALANYQCQAQVVSHLERLPASLIQAHQSIDLFAPYLRPAIQGFFRSIALGRDKSLQDILRLLTLWFKHGARPDVESALVDGFNSISIDTWLDVIPQLIARIHTQQAPIRRLIHELLTRVGRSHPQALIYPLTVASKSQSQPRKDAALKILDRMRQHSSVLVEQALMVSKELIRVALLWHEIWHEGLEEASRLYFGARNVEGMFATLNPLHEMMEKGPETLREVAFQQAFGRDLQEAHEWCRKFTRSGKDSDLNQAWELYYHVFRRINKQLPQLTELELQYVSPRLLAARDLELAVPGTYRAGRPVVRIASFVPSLRVIESKQRPRKLTIRGSDGIEYSFLLKAKEDLRQDERVMQLFGLVNTLLSNDRETNKQDLHIQRCSVIPLSPNSGLIEWLPHTDTLHALIKEYRDARKILLNIEHRLMLQMAPDYQNLTLMQKVEVFEYALANTTGQDLYKVLWLKSQNSEIWLDRRTNCTRSLAVMSMVGYILGLGDRHPCNLMLDRYTGKIIHIDFGDCFEVAMTREKFPEKIPFRLTRMLINAMEVSGIEGNFRTTCSRVMRVLRENKESVMAVLEAFVHDPLINWRLLKTDKEPKHDGRGAVSAAIDNAGGDAAAAIAAAAAATTGMASSMVASSSVAAAAAAAAALAATMLANANANQTSSATSAGAVGAGALVPAGSSASSTSAAVSNEVSSSLASANGGDRELIQRLGPDNEAAPAEVLNERAVAVIARVSNKLTGRDFENEVLDVNAQVRRLIRQATSHENLCQCYIGWYKTLCHVPILVIGV